MARLMYHIRIGSLSGLLIFLICVPPPQKIKVYLIGDFTMANKKVSAYPETGELSARQIAQLVLAEIKTPHLDLANRIVKWEIQK